MKSELIKKIEKSNISKEDKKQLIKSLNKDGNDGVLKKLFYLISISDKILDLFDNEIQDFIEDVLKL